MTVELYKEINAENAQIKIHEIIKNHFNSIGYEYAGGEMFFLVVWKGETQLIVNMRPKKEHKDDIYFTNGEYEIEYISKTNEKTNKIKINRKRITHLDENINEDLQTLEFEKKKLEMKKIFVPVEKS